MPKTLSDPPAEPVRALVSAAKQRRLVLYLGAGVSAPSPSCGPTGDMVADRIRPDVAQILGCDAADLTALSLEKLAQRVADRAADRLDELRTRAAEAFDFRGIEPNSAHAALALLLREGLIEVVSVNWDCGVERAGIRAAVPIESVADAAERLKLSHTQLPLYKVHGCSTRPLTLALTRDEVDRPQTWAVAQVQSALTGGFVVFVGLGTVGLYLSQPIAELLTVWTEGDASVRVVDPHLSDAWKDVLPEPDKVHIEMGSVEFLDDLLRSVVTDAIGDTIRSTRLLMERETWARRMEAGLVKVCEAFDTCQGDAVLRWWRDGVIDTAAGKPFITELSGKKALMTVGLLAGLDSGAVEASGVRGRLSMRTQERYFEIVCRPGEHVSDVERVARARVEQRREEAVYAEPKRIAVVIADAFGKFPAREAPVDIAGGTDELTDIATGIDSTVIELVSAEDGVRGRLP